MSSFVCPFCKSATSLSADNYWYNLQAFGGSISYDRDTRKPINPHIKLEIFRCANDHCKKDTIKITGYRGEMDNKSVFVYPQAVFRHFPDYVPEQIRKDYEEACLIRDLSPKASATLSRRCLQGMIRNFWNITGRNLNDEINQLQEKVSAAQWKAIDALRKIGNIGAHMEKDTDLIIDIAPEEASQLISLIELLIDKWYIARHDEEELYASITSTNTALQAQRNQSPDNP